MIPLSFLPIWVRLPARARKFTQKLDMPLAIIDKRRPKANVSEVMNIIGNVEGKKCILVDYLIDTGRHAVTRSDALVSAAARPRFTPVMQSHGVLSGPRRAHPEQRSRS